MEKIVVDYVYNNHYSACSKAREDVNIIAQRYGFVPFLINTRTSSEQSEINNSAIYNFYYKFRKLFILLRSIFLIKRGTLVLLQHPLAPFGDSFSLLFCRCLKMKKCYLVILVHDSMHFRSTETFSKIETKLLNCASELIIHTPQMQKLFKKNGVNRPCRLLWLFDYLTQETPNNNSNHDANSIAFAGALHKSEFLKNLKDAMFNNICVHLFGNKPHDTVEYPKWLKYIGRFSPENVTALTEGWGLTWDGDSIEELHGPLGNYLKYNSSHKVSLYIAAGIPLILSKDSALAEYVEKNKLGITISSLLELDQIIPNQDKVELEVIRKSVMEKSAVLRNGEMLGTILKDILKVLETKFN